MIIENLNKDLKDVLKKIDDLSNHSIPIISKAETMSYIHNNNERLKIFEQIITNEFTFPEIIFICANYRNIKFESTNGEGRIYKFGIEYNTDDSLLSSDNLDKAMWKLKLDIA